MWNLIIRSSIVHDNGIQSVLPRAANFYVIYIIRRLVMLPGTFQNLENGMRTSSSSCASKMGFIQIILCN